MEKHHLTEYLAVLRFDPRQFSVLTPSNNITNKNVVGGLELELRSLWMQTKRIVGTCITVLLYETLLVEASGNVSLVHDTGQPSVSLLLLVIRLSLDSCLWGEMTRSSTTRSPKIHRSLLSEKISCPLPMNA
jgi:hypothetical protein